MTEEYTQQQSFYITRSVSLFISILIELYRFQPEFFPMRGHSTMETAVLNAQRYVNDHFRQKLTLQEIADANFVSRHALSLGFKEIAGITFKEYLLLFRITEAKKLLVTTDLAVSQIAEQVGYVNVNNFLKIFKERENITPYQYRKQILSGSRLP
jgi:YesN/AraC family two-component response regulator